MAARPRRIALHVTPAAERELRAGHPWLFEGSIRQQRHPGAAGDLAVVFDRRDRFLAIGLLDPGSPIRVRLLHAGAPTRIDAAWMAGRIRAAAARRAGIPAGGTTGYRLVHGENDGLAGLVVDRFDRTLVVRLDTPAWIPWLPVVTGALRALPDADRAVLRLARSVAGAAGAEEGTVLFGRPPRGDVLFAEAGLVLAAEPVRGQKTGFFLDQRENRMRVGGLAAGREVLDAFSYAGGFSVHAARGGARAVTLVDRAGPALAAGVRNLERNRHLPAVRACRRETLRDDAFTALAALGEAGRRFGVVVTDPPSFARARDEVEAAARAYRALARLAARLVAPGGTLVACSCSSRVDEEGFTAAVAAGIAAAGRRVAAEERTGHPPDHPVGFPEGRYLKAVLARLA